MTAAMLAATESTIGPTLALILGAGMLAQWVAWRIQVPSIIALLIAGLLLGPVTGIVEPDELLGGTLFPLVSLAVALILFEGGLDLPPRELRNTGVVVRRLITVGAVVTFLIGWYGAREVFDISNQAAIVLGAVLVVTGPTVVGPLLRFVRPAGTTGPDPARRGRPDRPDRRHRGPHRLRDRAHRRAGRGRSQPSPAWCCSRSLPAPVSAWLLQWCSTSRLRRFLIPDQLTVPVTFAFVVASFVATNEVQEEAGLLTVTVMGMYLARRESSTIRQVLEFNESVRTLLISFLFILLAARIETDALREVIVPSLVFLALLVFLARPLSVLVSTVRTSLNWRERVFLMTMAPRGIVAAAVSAIFAIRLEEEGVPDAAKIVPIVFLVIIGTIVVYGFVAGPAARALGLAEAQADGVLIAGSHAVARGLATELGKRDVKTLLVDTDPYNVTRAIALGLRARRMSVLAEEASQDLDLRGIGRLLAFTSNDEVNALATARFARVFGRREVFQLAPSARRSGDTSVPEEHLGRLVGIEGITYSTIDERSRQGWRVRTAHGGKTIQEAVDADLFLPVVRIVDGKLAFLCRNDPLPTEGNVIGLAAPSLQQQLDDEAELSA